MRASQFWKIFRLLFAFTALIPTLILNHHTAHSATWTVTNINDSGAGSLRQAILDANSEAGPHTIEFDIPGCSGACVIQPATPLPALVSGDTTINGYSQPGSAPATASSLAIIRVELDGSALSTLANGLAVNSANNVIKGLSIHRFPGNGIWIYGSSSISNAIEGNYLGLDAGLVLYPGNALNGILINQGANDNTVGGSTPASRNVISMNGWSGIEIHGPEATGNVVSGNYIGTHPDGAGASENTMHGIRIYGGAHHNTIGGDTPGERNLLSGNTLDGVRIEGIGSDSNLIMVITSVSIW